MDFDAETGAGFRPPFCPNANCPHHHELPTQWRWKRAGFFTSRSTPHRIQRFTCLVCKRSFSAQTFSTTYWLKRPDLPRRIFMRIVGGMAARQIARDVRVAPSTIDRLVARLGRHCLLLHTCLTAHALPAGPLAMDGFESFEFSQYFPFQHHVLVEVDTSFFWYFTDSPLRRKGRMTAIQRRRREKLEHLLGRPDPRAVEKDVCELLRPIVNRVPEIILRSDDYRTYPRALRTLQCRYTHEITSSRERRTSTNPLFEINLLDGLIRHSQANHRRETLAWSKRRQGAAERLGIFLVWRNYMKRRWEKHCFNTPAMLKSLLARRMRVDDALQTRLFRTRIELPQRWAEYYDRRVQTVALGRNRGHALRYAY
jgi:transposase-like protein